MYLTTNGSEHVYNALIGNWCHRSFDFPMSAAGVWLSSEVLNTHVQLHYWVTDDFGDLVETCFDPYMPEVREVQTCIWVPNNCPMGYDAKPVGH